MAGAVPKAQLLTTLLPLYSDLIKDDQDSVRLLSIQQTGAISARLSQAENVEHLLAVVTACAEDKSWRVRLTIAKDFFQVCAHSLFVLRLCMCVFVCVGWLFV